MKNKQVFLGMGLLLGMFSLVFASQEKKNFLSRMVASSPITTLFGGYLLTKDLVHWQLNAHIPHVYVKDLTTHTGTVLPSESIGLTFPAEYFPLTKERLKETYLKGKASWDIIPRLRYRNLGGCLLGLAIVQTLSKN